MLNLSNTVSAKPLNVSFGSAMFTVYETLSNFRYQKYEILSLKTPFVNQKVVP